ncbi:MAG: hypothetical protein CL878_07080 [Dehalococcoidia bacterium]|nr:hypothetical protein [Dehalococcoidia bacterium]
MTQTHRLPFVLGLSLRVLLIGGVALAAALFATGLSRGQHDSLQPTIAGAQSQATPAPQGTPTTLNVVGDIEQRHAPDMAIVSLGVRTTGTTAAEASNTNNEVMAAVVAAIKAAGIADKHIQSTRISLTPVYARPSRDNPNAPPTITGYQAANTVSVRVLAIDEVGKILDAGLGAGANQLGGISFALQDTTQPYLDALAAATREARKKADAIATAAGMTVSGIVEITEETAGVPRPLTARSAQFAEAAAPVPVQAGEIVVQARVRVQFHLGVAPVIPA